MKKHFFALFLLISTISIVSCTKSASDNANPAATAATQVVSGSWKVTTHVQRTENKTSEYNGMNFTFQPNGTLMVTGTRTATGKWSVSGNVFIINMGNDNELKQLNENWKVESSTSSQLQLRHPEAAEQEYVTFAKQ